MKLIFIAVACILIGSVFLMAWFTIVDKQNQIEDDD